MKLLRAWIFLGKVCLFTSGCAQAGIYSLKIIQGGDLTIPAGTSEDSDIFLLNGSVHIEEGGVVVGSIYQLFGTLLVYGRVDGDLAQFGGDLVLGSQAQVLGRFLIGSVRPLPSEAGGAVLGGTGVHSVQLLRDVREFLRLSPLFMVLGEMVLLAGLAWSMRRYFPNSVSHVGAVLVDHLVVSAAMGLLVGMVSLALVVQMAFTIVLLPVSILGILPLAAAIGYGWVAFGAVVGDWIARRWYYSRSPAVHAAVGALIWVAFLNIFSFLPVLGDLLAVMSAVIGLGAVFLTRFGFRKFIPESTPQG